MNGKPLKFDFFGLYNAVVTMYDRDTESVWLQVGGRAIRGPLLGTKLKSGPLLDITWGKWKQLHPDTLVMSPDTPYARYYAPKGQRTYRGSPGGFPALYFRNSLTRGDRRLKPFDMVLAVAMQQPVGEPRDQNSPPEETTLYRAYPIVTLKESSGVLNDTLGGAPVGVLFDAEDSTAVAVSRALNGKVLTLEARKQADGKTAFYDKETGTRWNLEGKGEEGLLAGKTLTRLDSHMSEWYGWASYFPETSLYGRTDPPQTFDLPLLPTGPEKSNPPADKPEGDKSDKPQ